jgi:hypothetical protein
MSVLYSAHRICSNSVRLLSENKSIYVNHTFLHPYRITSVRRDLVVMDSARVVNGDTLPKGESLSRQSLASLQARLYNPEEYLKYAYCRSSGTPMFPTIPYDWFQLYCGNQVVECLLPAAIKKDDILIM